MDSIWSNSRKQTRNQADSSGLPGGSKLVQLQRQNSAINTSGLSSLSVGAQSPVSPGLLSSNSNRGSGAINPGLSAFLTGPSFPSSLGTFDSNDSNISSIGVKGNIREEDYHRASKNDVLYGTETRHSGSIGLAGSEKKGQKHQEIHPLRFNWVFWFMHRTPGSKILNYEDSMKRIASFGSVEDFWAVYSHLRRPHELPHVSDYHLFRVGVRPVWEDEANINGGKWIVRLKKGLASRYWENLTMAVVGDQFDVGSEICGVVLSIRGAEDILSLWNRSANNGRINLKIKDTMRRVLSLPPDTIMEYKTHNDALKDKSSFRNTDIFK